MSAAGKWVLGAIVIGVVAAVLAAIQPPAWALVLLGSVALALLYIARLGSRFDPLDTRFGSCIPPINTKPKDRGPPRPYGALSAPCPICNRPDGDTAPVGAILAGFQFRPVSGSGLVEKRIHGLRCGAGGPLAQQPPQVCWPSQK
jgi:hypothetical protein